MQVVLTGQKLSCRTMHMGWNLVKMQKDGNKAKKRKKSRQERTVKQNKVQYHIAYSYISSKPCTMPSVS